VLKFTQARGVDLPWSTAETKPPPGMDVLPKSVLVDSFLINMC
jgi:hypothetical protein